MTEDEIVAICMFDESHRYYINNLDDKTKDFVFDVLFALPANAFNEINPNAKFCVSDIPIPLTILSRQKTNQTNYSEDIEKEFDNLLNKINTKGTNIEYGCILTNEQNSETTFDTMFYITEGSKQSVDYDWDFIQKKLLNYNCSNFALFHTHPKAINESYETLYNTYPDILKKMGVKPDGLNLSLSDIFVNQYMDYLCEKNNANITPQSVVLMHDGTLLSFKTSDGVEITGEQKINLNNIFKLSEERTL